MTNSKWRSALKSMEDMGVDMASVTIGGLYKIVHDL